MGGLAKSAGGLLGIGSGPEFDPGTNPGLAGLGAMNAGTTLGQAGIVGQQNLSDYASGKETADQAGQNYIRDLGGMTQQLAPQFQGFENQLATGATTGTRFARDQMSQDPTQQGLYGQDGQMGKVEGKLNSLYDQGFNLTPEDQTMYGQMSGNIARQFGAQGNQVASDLASRGLSSSGAAGAAFSGLAGNQNEMLAQAQQQIAQQRFQNTMGQIGQYQNFVSGLGNQYNNALQQQYGRQLSGAQNQEGALGQQGGLQQSANQTNLGAQEATQQYAPKNAIDIGAPIAAQAGMAALTGGASLAMPAAGAAMSATSGNNFGASSLQMPNSSGLFGKSS